MMTGVISVTVRADLFLLCLDFDSQAAFICSKLTIETLEQGVKYVQS